MHPSKRKLALTQQALAFGQLSIAAVTRTKASSSIDYHALAAQLMSQRDAKQEALHELEGKVLRQLRPALEEVMRQEVEIKQLSTALLQTTYEGTYPLYFSCPTSIHSNFVAVDGAVRDLALLEWQLAWQTLIDEGKITDQEYISDYYKKQDTIKTLREEYCFKRAHAVECANDKALKDKGSVEEALEWLRFHKENDYNEAMKLKEKKDAGEEYKVIEKEGDGSDDDDDK